MDKVIFLCIIILLVACESKSGKIKIVSSPNKEVFLKGKSLGMAELLAHPSRIYYWDSLLYMTESTDDYKMIICDPSGKRIVNKLIPKGRGPGEQIGTFFFASNQKTRKLYSFDITLQKILELDRDSVTYSFYKPQNSYAIPSDLSIIRGTLIRDSVFVACGNTPNFRVATFTLKGEVNKFGDSPDVKQDMDEIINQAYSGVIKVSPCGSKFVIGCRHADQLEIFNFKDPHQLFVKGPELFEPQYSVKKIGTYKVLAHKKDEQLGYTDVDVTDDYIYALYSGKILRPENVYSNRIRVFSWKGDYLMDYILDHEVLAFALDENKNCIYGIVSESGAEIYRFDLFEK